MTVPVNELRRRQPRFNGLKAGHRACQGCGLCARECPSGYILMQDEA